MAIFGTYSGPVVLFPSQQVEAHLGLSSGSLKFASGKHFRLLLFPNTFCFTQLYRLWRLEYSMEGYEGAVAGHKR